MNDKKYAPIVLFAFIRLDSLQKAVSALEKNELASKSDLFIFVDGPKDETQKVAQKPLIEYVNSLNGGGNFKSVTIKHSLVNKGLDPSVISGVTEIVNLFGKAIVLEDDIVTTPNFLDFMNQALDVYESDDRVMSISGFGLKVKKPKGYDSDVYLFGRSSSWGWATWSDRWNAIDWDIKDWEQFKNSKQDIRRFKKSGGSDMFSMLETCMKGGGMWDIRFCYNMFKQNRYSIVPFLSKVENIGFGGMATHCKTVHYNRFKYCLDDTSKSIFEMPTDIKLNSIIIKSRLKYQSFSLRLYSKIRNILKI